MAPSRRSRSPGSPPIYRVRAAAEGLLQSRLRRPTSLVQFPLQSGENGLAADAAGTRIDPWRERREWTYDVDVLGIHVLGTTAHLLAFSTKRSASSATNLRSASSSASGHHLA